MGYVLAAATLPSLVLAHDTSNADPHDLGSHYESRSVPRLSNATRWFYCGGLGVALLSMGVISLAHTHKRLAKARLMKRPRLAVRAVVAVGIIFLAFADNLSSLSLIGITTSLTIFILTLDLYGNSAQGSSFWTGGCCIHERKRTSYIAHHRVGRRRREEIRRALERGEKVGLAELLRRGGVLVALTVWGEKREGAGVCRVVGQILPEMRSGLVDITEVLLTSSYPAALPEVAGWYIPTGPHSQHRPSTGLAFQIAGGHGMAQA